MITKIKNAYVFKPHSGFSKEDIIFSDKRYLDKETGLTQGATQIQEVDLAKEFANQKIYAFSGLVDTHIHGAMGADICDGELSSIKTIAEYEASRGITTLVPATMTMDEKTLIKAGNALKEAAQTVFEKGCSIEGAHMEGPFINIDKRGAQNPEFVHKPDTDFYNRLQDASGQAYKIVTMAPETEGGMEFIDKHHEEISISVGHTCGGYDVAYEAFQRGANRLTHCYNAMGSLHHREPGPIAAAADHPHTWVEIITDGIHVDPAMVRIAFRIFGPERIVMISDSMRATGLKDGIYTLGGQEVTVKGREARIASGSLAGSVTDLFACVETAVTEMKIPLEDALLCASYNPVKALGMEKDFGSIEAGKYANLVLFNEKFEILGVWVKGNLIKTVLPLK